MSDYEFHPEAEIDLNEIWDYIAADNITAADRLIGDIHDTLELLVPFPHQGHKRPDLTSRPLRFKRVRDYLIVYAPDENLCGLSRSSMGTAIHVSWQPSCGDEKLSLSTEYWNTLSPNQR